MARRILRILLVGESGSRAELIKFALADAKSFASDVSQVDRLAAAMDKVKSAEFDAVLLDARLPECDGPATVAALRCVNEMVPILAVLEAEDEDTALRFLKNGAQDFLFQRFLATNVLERAILCAIERMGYAVARPRRAIPESDRPGAMQYTLVTANESKNFADNVLAGLDVIVVVLTPAQRFASINRRCEEVAGYSMAELKDRTFASALVCAHEAAAIESAFRRLDDGEQRVAVESYLLTKHGETRRIEWSFRTLRNADESVQAYVGVGVDVTRYDNEAKRAEQLEQEIARLRQAGSQHAAASANGGTVQRRAHPRIEFFHRQRIALLEDGTLPVHPSFCEVLCSDLSQGGFAYLVGQRPKYREVVIALGSGANVRYMKAEVRHVQLAEHEGEPLFRVGCKFLERIEIRDFELRRSLQC